MNINQMKLELSNKYKSATFDKKLNKMSDAQVVAIYFRIFNKQN